MLNSIKNEQEYNDALERVYELMQQDIEEHTPASENLRS